MSEPKYPNIEVDLSESDGNAFSILGRVRKAMRKAGLSDAIISAFDDEARQGDYDHLLQTCMKWVEVS